IMNYPWIESVDFPEKFKQRPYTPEEEEMILSYRNEGLVVLRGFYDSSLCRSLIEELSVYYQEQEEKGTYNRRVQDIWKLNGGSLSKKIVSDSRIMEILRM